MNSYIAVNVTKEALKSPLSAPQSLQTGSTTKEVKGGDARGQETCTRLRSVHLSACNLNVDAEKNNFREEQSASVISQAENSKYALASGSAVLL